jgi:protocatechuate 3,4-dioxygenase beta subunit
MKFVSKLSLFLRWVAGLLILAACAAPATPSPVEIMGPPPSCSPTSPDQLGPFYTPGAPERDKVGEGYVLSGVVRSDFDCYPIPGAQIEFWMAGPDGVYTDAYRATEFSGSDGSYRFESHFPPPYSGRPPHIHIRVSAPGFDTLVTQHYPVSGATQAVLDLVLVKT